MLPIQVGHLLGVLVQIVLAGELVEFPGGAVALTEAVAPAVGLGAVAVEIAETLAICRAMLYNTGKAKIYCRMTARIFPQKSRYVQCVKFQRVFL